AYGKRLFHLENNITNNDEYSEEFVKSTYVKTWNKIPPQCPSFFFAYIAKICRHLALDKFDWNKATKRKAEIVSLSYELEMCIPDNRSTDELQAKELGAILDSFLHSLSRENRIIFMRRYWYADSISQIAKHFEMSESAVSMRLNRSRERLRAHLEKEGVCV
ncbi:MAG: sigma-70 family RNA polymerase sigma factor, partial [Oscillospiraceae bacterium]|nr:sigma-70 family RNA polymerase sigma factor [Oscillospiraceae bacterium]